MLITSYCRLNCILSRQTIIALMMEEGRIYQPEYWYQKWEAIFPLRMLVRVSINTAVTSYTRVELYIQHLGKHFISITLGNPLETSLILETAVPFCSCQLSKIGTTFPRIPSVFGWGWGWPQETVRVTWEAGGRSLCSSGWAKALAAVAACARCCLSAAFPCQLWDAAGAVAPSAPARFPPQLL